jgi:diguanylate cyclase (GGDEF)-like protein
MNHQILIIDDAQKIHPLIKAILAREPVDVHCATDPNHGLILAASILPDLILLDVQMPEMDGFEVCRQLKADPTTAKCPIIFLTSRSETKEKVHGFGLGAMDYITKPFNAAELVARVRSSLKTNRVIRSLEETALIDPLTNLGNRAMFVRRMSAEICLRARSGNPLSITLMELDHFDALVQTYGRPVGNQVLSIIGEALLDSYRLEDVACHFGDGEFGIITPSTNAADAITFAEQVRQILACRLIKPEGNPLSVMAQECVRVTASFGVAEAVMPYDRSMIQRAGEALRKAQLEGRNRVSLASTSIQEAA